MLKNKTSSNHSYLHDVFMNARRALLLNNHSAHYKAEILSQLSGKLILHLHFTKSPKCDNILFIYCVNRSYTRILLVYSLNVNALACSKAEI